MGSSTFYYGGERELVVQVESNGSASATRTYVGDVYEKSVLGTTTEERFYVRSPAGLVAIRTVRTGQPTSLKYVHRDHLGSTDVLTDATGAAVQRMSFDAWGKRRDPSTWSDSALYAYAFEGGVGFSVTPQYTGHVGLGHLELVHMQGRVYDPVLGRFLSADPYVQDPASTQSFNRYAYVWNNPLSSTDPSGYFSLKSLGHAVLWSLGIPPRLWSKFTGWVRRLAKKQWLAPIVGAVLSFVPGAGPFLGALVAAGLQTAINGGSIGEILLAAGVAFATGAITQGVLDGLGTALTKVLPTPGPILGADGTSAISFSSASIEVAEKISVAEPAFQASAAAQAAAVGGAAARAEGERDWVNPTGGKVRGCDARWGCGEFGASRDSGQRQHLGTDYTGTPGQEVRAVTGGTIGKPGYPYGDDLSYRYIRIDTPEGYVVRELYVRPAEGIRVGTVVRAGQPIGTQQLLGARYPGITEHVHVDITRGGLPVNPETLIRR